MNPRRKTHHRRSRRASVLTQTVIFGGAVGVGVAALAIDTGLMFASKQELQNAADAAALAAASQLGQLGEMANLATVEASTYSELNKVAGLNVDLIESDVVFGHAVLNGEKFDFQPNEQPYDAVNVTLKRDNTVADGPVSMIFAKTFGVDGANITASATAMLVPRDIDLVIDLSGSMNDDSELRHYDDFASETSGTRPGVQINLEDVWAALPTGTGVNGIMNGANAAAPSHPPSSGSNHPGNGSGQPSAATGSGNGLSGPRFGWMTKFGNAVTLGQYTPVGDSGLYYIPRSSTCSDADVIANLTESGYSSAERTALLSGQYDGDSTMWRNRVKVLLGLAAWKSKKSGGKYTGGSGDGDNQVDSNELANQAPWTFDGGSWNSWVDYVSSSTSQMKQTDGNFRYRFGIKTFANYLLEQQSNNNSCPELVDAPEQPLQSVKDAVQAMIDLIISLETQDYMALETFAQYGYHELDLPDADSSSELVAALQEIPETLNARQAGHYTSVTNIGAGLDFAIDELTSSRARESAAKVVILLTDGKPNTNSSNTYVGNDDPEAIEWCLDRADQAKEMGMTVYTIGVGGDVNEDLCEQIATTPENYFFADSNPDPVTGEPMYVQQLNEIFETLGGKRPVRLIQ